MTHPIPLRISFDGRRLSITDEQSGAIGFARLGGSVEVDENLIRTDSFETINGAATTAAAGSVGDRSYALASPDGVLRWEWRLEMIDGACHLTARLVNTGDTAIEIGAWNVLHADPEFGSSIKLPGTADTLRFFGWHPWNMRVERIDSDNGVHESNNLCHLSDPVSNTTALLGFVTLDRMLCRHTVTYRPETGIAEYRAECSLSGFRLDPGATVASETLLVSGFSDPYAALESWAEEVRRRYRPEFADLPPVGWTGAWIDAFSDREKNWEQCALENAELIRRHLPGFDVRYLWTSQYNLADGLPGNWLNVEERQIPSGLAEFFNRLRRLEFTPGLWVAPFWFFEEAAGVLEENRDNLLEDGSEKPISEPGSWEFDRNADPEGALRLTKYYLDGTKPGTREFIRRVFDRYRALGVGYYMLDFLAIKNRARLADQSMTHVEAARSVIGIIREAAGKETHLQTAVASTPGFVGLIAAARVGRDFGEGRPLFPPYNCWRNAIYTLHDEHFGNTRYLVQNAAASWFTHRRIYINDFNILAIDKPVPLEHARIAVTVFGLGGGSPLMLGDDFRIIDPERLRMIKLCLPRTTGMFVPVDLFDHVYPDDMCNIVKLQVKTACDSYLLVAVFNLDEGTREHHLDFETLGLGADVPIRVWEFWTGEYHGTFAGGVRSVVMPGTCKLFRLAQARRHPWLLSTDMHVQQGAVEITNLEWNGDRGVLSGTATRPAGETGNLFFHMPRTYRLVNHEGCHLVKDVRDMHVIVRKPLHFETDTARFELQFEPVGTRFVARRGWLPYATEEEWREYVEQHRDSDDTRVYDV